MNTKTTIAIAVTTFVVINRFQAIHNVVNRKKAEESIRNSRLMLETATSEFFQSLMYTERDEAFRMHTVFEVLQNPSMN